MASRQELISEGESIRRRLAQAFRMAIDVEEYTRRTAEAVEKLLRQEGIGHG